MLQQRGICAPLAVRPRPRTAPTSVVVLARAKPTAAAGHSHQQQPGSSSGKQKKAAGGPAAAAAPASKPAAGGKPLHAAGAAPGHGTHTVAAAAVAVAIEEEVASAASAVVPQISAAVAAAAGASADPGTAAALKGGFGQRRGVGSQAAGPAGEVDVALAGSDEELDAVDSIVPAGVLGAAGLAGVTSTGPSPSASSNGHRCLVLDASYRPINTTSWFKAVMMDVAGKVDVVDYYDDAVAYSAYRSHALPAVMRARASVNLHELVGRIALTRRNVLARDQHQCQYCGSRQNLTLDHVLPVCRGGRNTWENLVTCCMHCNQRKGSTLLRDLPGWRLRTVPREPTLKEMGLVLGVSQGDLDNPHPKWQAWLEPYRTKSRRRRGAAAAAAEPDGGGAGPGAPAKPSAR